MHPLCETRYIMHACQKSVFVLSCCCVEVVPHNPAEADKSEEWKRLGGSENYAFQLTHICLIGVAPVSALDLHGNIL